ncbi:MAG: hypothetical protein GF418_13070, partial [Chitinivibrionales bacterium]|nr:hypothetical protein [Chitinivibrionales bacterium]MBD3396550.1 hypothetical protein [Chitinivibrionales bacterium]
MENAGREDSILLLTMGTSFYSQALIPVRAAVIMLGLCTLPTIAVRIMPFGDSITAGEDEYGAYRADLYAMLDSAGIVLDYVGSQNSGPSRLPDRDHEGHWSWRIGDLAGMAGEWVVRYRPDVVLLMAGTNDMFGPDSMDTIVARLDSLVGTIFELRPNALVFLSSIPPIPYESVELRVEEFNDGIRELVRRRSKKRADIVFADNHAALTVDDLADGLHPSNEGYHKMAVVWYEA